ncbi:unnamed protein product [Prorocentrum cordatum]|uniref:Uncharacterized protein n=1 Tax=Prorocentrum cordatum TaxID=2364126 RepID=A0ABN9X2G7_9DINO|nr:unnamed protein product [Polarella glacialis]
MLAWALLWSATRRTPARSSRQMTRCSCSRRAVLDSSSDSESRVRRRAEKEERAQRKSLEAREMEDSAARVEAEVQRRVQERTASKEWRAALQERLDAELESVTSASSAWRWR